MSERAAWPQRAQTPASLSRFPKSTLEEVFVEGGGEILPKTLGNEVSLGSPEAGRKGTGLAQTFLKLAHDAGGGTGVSGTALPEFCHLTGCRDRVYPPP